MAPATENDPAAVLGQMAHVVAISDLGPRGASDLPAASRNDYENLVLLCPSHHTLVDKQPNSFEGAEVRRWKDQHEIWVRESLSIEAAGIGFAELEAVTHTLLGPFEPGEQGFEILAQEDKLERNGLSSEVALLLKIGELRAKDVRDYVEHVTIVDSEFASRLISGFVGEYKRLREQGEAGDELFESLRDFAGGHVLDFKRQAAGLAVLVYLFDICEVFER